jgi:hypothetical protein
MIYDFLTIHFDDKGINVTNFMISTAFPKADLTNMDATILDLVTHTAAMLCYSILLYSVVFWNLSTVYDDDDDDDCFLHFRLIEI